jgi:hypothetical protein
MMGEFIFETVSKRFPDSSNRDKVINDAIELLPFINSGLDVNCTFNSVTGFEYTSSLGIFDLVNVRLFHGWCVDPEDRVTASVLKNSSYNQIMEKVVQYQNLEGRVSSGMGGKEAVPSLLSESELAIMSEGSVINEFLHRTASQLTYYGLSQIYATMREREIAVLFRNNHFSTLFKIDGDIYILATDVGYARNMHVVWEKLNEISGDTLYYDSNFNLATNATDSYPASPSPYDVLSPRTSPDTGGGSAIIPSTHYKGTIATRGGGSDNHSSDYDLARQLQEQMNIEDDLVRRQEAAARERHVKKEECSIL